MKAINANAVPAAARFELERRFFPSHFDRAEAKRTDRRRQRKALRAELSWLVDSSLEAEMEALVDIADDIAKAERAMSKLSFAKLKALATVDKPKLHLLPDVEPVPVRSVTVIRKLPHRRPVVESVQVFAYPLAA